MKKQYIAPISERVFPESIMDDLNPGGGNIINSGSNIVSTHEIVAPKRLKYL